MVNLLFMKKAISKFSLCYMKKKKIIEANLSLVISIPCSTCLLVLNKDNELFFCLKTSKMLSLGVFDRYESC